MSLERGSSARWWMLLLISLGFVELTLNWFDVAAAFPQIGAQFRLAVPQLALLISLFLAGYGLFHIPTGFLAARFGLRRILLAGLLVESVCGALSGIAPNYPLLAVLRLLTGIGGSLFVGTGFASVTAWFRDRELALAQGISGGAGFAVGAAIALYVWVAVIHAVGWGGALGLGGVAGFLIWLVNLIWLRLPAEERAQLASHNLSWASVGRVLKNRNLWLYGLSLLGGYGAYFTTSQLMASYAAATFKLAAGAAALLAAVIVLAGIPGSVVGGFFSDRAKNRKAFIVGSTMVVGVSLLVVPFAGLALIWVVAAVVGFLLIFGFAAFTSVPGDFPDAIPPQDVATAEGLLLTILAVGGFLVPIGFGQLVASTGYHGGWIFLGVVTLVFSLVGLAAEDPFRRARAAHSETKGVKVSP
jgi:ACS family D-galactonate transporter-like MFS transporter